jgi:uncharacterized protein YkwD
MGNRTTRQMRAVAVVALTVAALSSARPARAQVADPAAETGKVLALVNQGRTTALARHCSLDSLAQSYATDMATHDYFGEKDSLGRVPITRQTLAGYFLKPYHELIQAGPSSAEAVVTAWRKSDAGSALSDPSYRDIGIAVAYREGTQYRYYWVVILAAGGDPCPTTAPPEQPGIEGHTRSLGGVATSAPQAAYDGGRLYLFVRGTDGAVWYRRRGDLASNWEDWRSLGGPGNGSIQGNLALGQVGSGSGSRLAVFVRGADGALWYAEHNENPFTETAFSPWISLGGVLTSDPVVEQQSDGNPCVFVRGTDGALWYRKQSRSTVSNLLIVNTWSDWRSLGGAILGAPLVTRGSDGQLTILARGGNDNFWQRQDPALDAGTDPSKHWSGTNFSWGSSEWEGDVLLAPGSRASSPALLFSYVSEPTISWRGLQGGVVVDGGQLSSSDSGSTGKMAVARRPAGGFYLCSRRQGGKICVTSAEVTPEGVVRELGAPQNLASRPWSAGANLCVVADSVDGRPIVFSLDEKGGVEERWF